ncbi:LPXTG cell wall anchor domain-containing protein, partial [Jiangella rhizosphaerae]
LGSPGAPKPPPGETGTPAPKPTPKPTGSAAPPMGGDDDTTAGGGLPNTGPGDVAQALGVGGLLTAAGAAMYVASRKESPEPGDAQPGATA